ncbi:MAG: hypothetical protein ACK5LV_04465 [Lachnospirales bacterium]
MKKFLLVATCSTLAFLGVTSTVLASSIPSDLNARITDILTNLGFNVAENADFTNIVSENTDLPAVTSPNIVNGNYRVQDGYMHIDDALTKFSGTYVYEDKPESNSVIIAIPDYYDKAEVRYTTINGVKYLNLSELGRYYGNYTESYYRKNGTNGGNSQYSTIQELATTYPLVNMTVKDYDDMYLSIDGYYEREEADYFESDGLTYVETEDVAEFYNEYLAYTSINNQSNSTDTTTDTNTSSSTSSNTTTTVPRGYITIDEAKSTYSEIIDYKQASSKEMYPIYKGNLIDYDEEIEFRNVNGTIYLEKEDVQDAVEEFYDRD